MLLIFAATLSCAFGFDCDHTEALRKNIEAIPGVKEAYIVKNTGNRDAYHATIFLNSGDRFHIGYITLADLKNGTFFGINWINGWQIGGVGCSGRPMTQVIKTGQWKHARIGLNAFSLGVRGNFQNKVALEIQNIQDIIKNFPAIKDAYFKIVKAPEYAHEFLADGSEFYVSLRQRPADSQSDAAFLDAVSEMQKTFVFKIEDCK